MSTDPVPHFRFDDFRDNQQHCNSVIQASLIELESRYEALLERVEELEANQPYKPLRGQGGY